MTNRAEYGELRSRMRKHRRNARVSTLAFAIAVGLLAFATFQNVSYRDALQQTTQAMEAQQDVSQDTEAMIHYIKTLQGSLNACRKQRGEPPLVFDKY